MRWVFLLNSLIMSRTEVQENMIVTCSRQLTAIRSGDLDFRYFRVLLRIVGGHITQHYNLSSWQYDPHPMRHAFSGNNQSQSSEIVYLIGISHLNAVGDVAILERRLISSRMGTAMLNFSF